MARQDALELEAWWRGRASFERVFWRDAKNSRVNYIKTSNPTKLSVSKKKALCDVTAETALP